MGLARWIRTGLAAGAASILSAPILATGVAFAQTVHESEPVSIDSIASNCDSYPQGPYDAYVSRTNKTWGNFDTLNIQRQKDWLRIGSTASDSGDALPRPTCVVVKGVKNADGQETFSHKLSMRTFGTDGDYWAGEMLNIQQSVDIFASAVRVPDGAKIGVQGKVRSQIPSEFKAGIMVDAASISGSHVLKSPMRIGDEQTGAILTFDKPGIYAITWTAEMNRRVLKLHSGNVYTEVFKVESIDSGSHKPGTDTPGTNTPEGTTPGEGGNPSKPEKPDPGTPVPPKPNPETPDPEKPVLITPSIDVPGKDAPATGGSDNHSTAPSPGMPGGGQASADRTAPRFVHEAASRPSALEPLAERNLDRFLPPLTVERHNAPHHGFGKDSNSSKPGSSDPNSALPPLDRNKERSTMSPTQASARWASNASTGIMIGGIAVAAVSAAGGALTIFARP